MSAFKAKLFDLIDAASEVFVGPYEIDEYSDEDSPEFKGHVIRLACCEDNWWYFRDQEVEVIDGQASAISVTYEGEGCITEESVDMAFLVSRAITERDVELLP